MKKGKLSVTLNGEITEVVKGMSKKTGVSPSVVLENLIIGALAEAAARVEHSGDPDRAFIVPLMLRDADGNLLRGDQLFATVKALKISELGEMENVARVAGDRVFELSRHAGPHDNEQKII